MPKLLVSYFIRGRRAAPIGQRIWENGVAETYQTTRRVKGEDGVHRTVSVPPGWYQVATLSDTQLDAVRSAIVDAGVGDLPADISTVNPRFSDTSSAEWKLGAPGRRKKIKVAQWGPSLDEAAKPLMQLMMRMGRIVNFAAAGLKDVPD